MTKVLAFLGLAIAVSQAVAWTYAYSFAYVASQFPG